MFFGQGKQLVAHHHPGDVAGVKVARRRQAKHVHIRQHRHLWTAQLHVYEQLALLADIVADLGDDESRAVFDLLGQIEILRHDLPFMALEVAHRRAREETGALHVPAPCIKGQAGVQV